MALCLLLIGYTAQAQITTFPHTENFESFFTCSTSCTSPCALSNGWTQSSSPSGRYWITDVGGTGSFNTGPSVDHNPGTSSGKYLYTETSGCTNDQRYLVSPLIVGGANIVTNMVFWYHMFGAAMGTMQVDISSSGTGGPWVTIEAAFTANVNLWQTKTVAIPAAYGGGSFHIRFRGNTGTSFTSDMAVDDITFNAIASAPCSGTPSPGNTTSTAASACSGVNFTLGLQNSPSGSGLSYQWQSGPSATGPWTNAGAPPSCNYTFRMTDSFGDGWNGNTMSIRQGTTVIQTIGSTFTSGSGPVDVTVTLTAGVVYNLFWNSGGSFASAAHSNLYRCGSS